MAKEMLSCFIDTNLLIYAMDSCDPVKRERISRILKAVISRHRPVVSPQVLNEFYYVTVRSKTLLDPQMARDFLHDWSTYCDAAISFPTLQLAWKIEDEAGLQWWDCLLLASATQSKCDVFLSEDMQHGRRIGNMRILNPFMDATFNEFTV